jgi:hypothetical protein
MKRSTWIILGVLAVIVLWAISARNGFATAETDIV